jgi:2-oxoglutarate ferredoxin oxidoreductase subunit beta
VIDVISPCVTFHNQDNSHHSFTWARANKITLQELEYIPPQNEITIENFEAGTVRDVRLFDGSVIKLRKIENEYDPTDKLSAYKILAEADRENQLITGLIFINPEQPTLLDVYNLPEDLPLNKLPEERIRPTRDSIEQLNQLMF